MPKITLRHAILIVIAAAAMTALYWGGYREPPQVVFVGFAVLDSIVETLGNWGLIYPWIFQCCFISVFELILRCSARNFANI